MRNGFVFLAMTLLALPFAVLADQTSESFPLKAGVNEPGFFAGIDVTAGRAYGNSGTKRGGAPSAGGSIMHDVKFRNTTGLGGACRLSVQPASVGLP